MNNHEASQEEIDPIIASRPIAVGGKLYLICLAK